MLREGAHATLEERLSLPGKELAWGQCSGWNRTAKAGTGLWGGAGAGRGGRAKDRVKDLLCPLLKQNSAVCLAGMQHGPTMCIDVLHMGSALLIVVYNIKFAHIWGFSKGNVKNKY